MRFQLGFSVRKFVVAFDKHLLATLSKVWHISPGLFVEVVPHRRIHVTVNVLLGCQDCGHPALLGSIHAGVLLRFAFLQILGGLTRAVRAAVQIQTVILGICHHEAW